MNRPIRNAPSSRRSGPRSRRGFNLLEVLIALAITATLLTATVMFLAASATEPPASATSTTNPAAASALLVKFGIKHAGRMIVIIITSMNGAESGRTHGTKLLKAAAQPGLLRAACAR